MTNAGMLDAAIIAVLALFMFLGWRRGLLRSLAELAAVVVSLALAYQIAGFAAGAAVDGFLRPAAHEAIEMRVDQMLAENVDFTTQRAEMERVLDAIPNGYLREKSLALLDGLALSTAEQAGWSARETLVELSCSLADEALDTVVHGTVRGVVCALSFAVLLLVLRLAARALDLAARLPVIHQLNQLGGLLLGAGKGLILVCLAVWVLGRTEVLPPDVLADSALVCLAGRFFGA